MRGGGDTPLDAVALEVAITGAGDFFFEPHTGCIIFGLVFVGKCSGGAGRTELPAPKQGGPKKLTSAKVPNESY